MLNTLSKEDYPLIRLAVFFLTAFLVVLSLYLFWMAFQIQVTYFDTYSLSLNARRLASGEGSNFFWDRATLLPILLSPFYYLEHHFFSGGFAFLAGKILAVLFFILYIRVAYLFFRPILGKMSALCGAALLAMNSLLIHQAPFSKEDIPAALFSALAFYFYLKAIASRGWMYFVLTGLYITASMTCRHNLIPLLFVVIASHELLNGRIKFVRNKKGWQFRGENTARKILFFFILPALLFIMVPSVLYSKFGISPLSQAPVKVVKDLLFSFSAVASSKEPFMENGQFLLLSCTWPVIMLSIFGFLKGIYNRQKGILFFCLWLGIFFVVQTYVIRHYEGRYLFPLLLPFYFFVSCGIREVFTFLDHRVARSSIRSIVLCCMAVAVFALPLRNAVQECLKFQDPFYSTDFQKKISLYAKQLASGGHVYWVGEMYPLYPRDHIFHPGDEFTYIYHFYNHVVSYYIRERVSVLEPEEFLIPEGGRHGVFVRGVGNYTANGDVLIVNIEKNDYDTNALPQELAPIIITRVRHLKFFPGESTPGGVLFFNSSQIPDYKIAIRTRPQGYEIRGIGLPERYFELYLSATSLPEAVAFTVFKPVDGKFTLTVEGQVPQGIKEIFLLGYEDTIKFYATKAKKDRGAFGPGKKIIFDYVLRVDGEVKLNSQGKDPLVYTHGKGGILPALASQLEGLEVDDEKTILITPQEVSGQEDPALFQEVPKTYFSQGTKFAVGAIFDVENKQGNTYPAAVSEIREDTIILNFNQPLAWKLLEYQVKILEVE